ncbi:hypothetical protein [Usitatibacter palustris]|uniref:Uncharacterized protein n=1 Tax=Usitatibacter palustris TaxID=2732487 RepID=A0A6M4HA18_9PROT|nr:hypothetical protein [Usitatibacter palustris]QJR16396.1 hypothetical protein DSM104440_03230 [Usitatibacter palustris]
MNVVFSAAGLKRLRTSWIILALSIVVAAAMGASGHWFLEREKRDSTASGRKLQEARTRLEGVRRERENLIESAEVFRTLVDRGMLQSERRLEMIERVDELRIRHRMLNIEYEIAPQRPLPLAGGRSFASVDVLASRVKLKLQALHEGDLLGFLDDFTRSTQGFYPIDRCTLRRMGDVEGTDASRPRVEGECTLEWITLKEKGRAG